MVARPRPMLVLCWSSNAAGDAHVEGIYPEYLVMWKLTEMKKDFLLIRFLTQPSLIICPVLDFVGIRRLFVRMPIPRKQLDRLYIQGITPQVLSRESLLAWLE
ncbi:hypothetical protein TNCT_152271 [Trichonephila clavata]|uniref:Uncharacterized protein n=1 Tax=Trichonephila clavata TaxID=2740835 RepID=A0A8X6HHD3_TRICU|nr:hypothetical protein TNCT_152271 [Trichonephila clavata]